MSVSRASTAREHQAQIKVPPSDEKLLDSRHSPQCSATTQSTGFPCLTESTAVRNAQRRGHIRAVYGVHFRELGRQILNECRLQVAQDAA